MDYMSSRTFLIDSFARHVAERPDATAIATVDESRTFAELDAAASRLAGFLAGLGIRPGDRVGVVSRNRLELMELMLACIRSGATFLPLNWRFTAAELSEAVTVSELSVLIADLSVLPAGLGGSWLGVRLIDIDCLSELAADASPEFAGGDVGDAPLWHLFTSGTAARPKGAMTSPANLASELVGWARSWDVDEEAVLWNPYPSFHNTFTGVNTLISCMGGRIECRDSVTIDDLLWSIEERKITVTVMVPVVLRQFLDRPDLADRDLSSLRRIVCGSAPTPPDLLRKFCERISTCVLSNGYGMTETTTPITHIDFTAEDVNGGRIRSVGQPLPWMELSVRDPDTTEPVPAGTVGEVWVRSPTCVREYWRRPEETAYTMRADGWLRTADLGQVDEEGYVYLSDRLGDMIISGGENVSASEVESVLSRYPGVREVAVVGAPHERWGEAPVAFVVAEADAVIDAQELLAFARTQLARYKLPDAIHLVDELPRNATGKILRRDLRLLVRGSS